MLQGGELAAQPLHHAAGGFLAGAIDEDGELVAAAAADAVALAQAAAEQRRQGDQDAVAGGVAIAIVDRLEVVEVDDHPDGAMGGAAALELDVLAGSLHQGGAMQQPRQTVLVEQVVQVAAPLEAALDRRQQELPVQRLDEVIVAAGAGGRDALVELAARRHEQGGEGGVPLLLAQPAEQVVAAGAATQGPHQHDVGANQVELAGEAQRIGADPELVAGPFEDLAQRGEVALVVLDRQDPSRSGPRLQEVLQAAHQQATVDRFRERAVGAALHGRGKVVAAAGWAQDERGGAMAAVLAPEVIHQRVARAVRKLRGGDQDGGQTVGAMPRAVGEGGDHLATQALGREQRQQCSLHGVVGIGDQGVGRRIALTRVLPGATA